MSDATAPAQSPAPTTTSDAPAAAAAAAPAADKPYYESFGDRALAAHPSIQKHATMELLAKGYVGLEKSLGVPAERRIDLPEDPTNAEAMRPVWTRLGAPEKAEGYTESIKLPKGATEADSAVLKDFAENVAHKTGMPLAHAQAAVEWWLGKTAAAAEQAQAAMAQRAKDGETALKGELAGAYEPRMKEIAGMLARYDPDAKTGLKAENLTAYPEIARMLIRMADRMAEPAGDGRSGDAASPARPLSPLQAQAALATFSANTEKQKALLDRTHPAHKATLAERAELLKLADPRAQKGA